MVMFKLSLLISALLALGAVMPTVHAGNLVEIDTSDDPVTKRPKFAKIACVIKSTSCMSTNHYLSQDYGPQLKLTTCHHDSILKNWWNRITTGSGNGMFVNTFYVTACSYDDKTQKNDCSPKGLVSSAVRDMLDDVINTKSECNAYIDCNSVEEVDKKCFPKDGNASKEGEPAKDSKKEGEPAKDSKKDDDHHQ
ncbi:uncharacterized protein SPSC_02060 [Sporisorium scitamineum]|uniref:Secreted protein n=1 Tax=Sporisorium scitamineum TaxID=49012 RepID=A0A127ZBB4_9BASI|nr:uncharacterized protein SPSC_02060 [Sporisorium scitamineum]